MQETLELVTWWMTATEIRPIAEVPIERLGIDLLGSDSLRNLVMLVGWRTDLPGVAAIASRLPNWPRWARLLATLVVLGIVVVIVLLVRC